MTSSLSPVSPGETLGMLGGGQLGRMFIEAAHRLGYKVHVLAPAPNEPACQLADAVTLADYGDTAAVAAFAQQVSIVTYEFENIPHESVLAAEEYVSVRPGSRIIHIAQNRLREKQTLQEAGLPVTPFRPASSLEECQQAAAEFGLPVVIKTATSGYDGKGQRFVRSTQDLKAAWDALGRQELIVEKGISFSREISVIAVRSTQGDIRCYEPFENDHQNHILSTTLFPARIPDELSEQARSIAAKIMESQEVVGVLCVEFFVVDDETLYINEIAPRPHNSGHVTINACHSSQFDQQVRAVCGLPLGSTERLSAGAMSNLLGDLWDHDPDWSAPLALPGVSLHLYGKTEARPGRKMGHMTALADTTQRASDLINAARAKLAGAASSP
jgi:5-(carboxyamino)imidazole ribonucleotide synthase